MKCWVLKTTDDTVNQNHWKEFKKEGAVAIGWEVPPQKTFSEQQLIDHIKRYCYPEGSDKQAIIAAQKVLRFAREMEVGDKVLICNGYAANSHEDVHIYGLARVTGEFRADMQSKWFKNKRDAKIIPIQILKDKSKLANIIGLGSCRQAIHEINCNRFLLLQNWLGVKTL